MTALSRIVVIGTCRHDLRITLALTSSTCFRFEVKKSVCLIIREPSPSPPVGASCVEKLNTKVRRAKRFDSCSCAPQACSQW
jgi:hypothetical protein